MFMVGVTFIIAGMVVWVINAAPSSKTYSMVVTGIHEPIKHESALLAYLEATYPGESITMKELVEAVATQNDTNIWIRDRSFSSSDVRFASNDILGQWLSNMPYMLVLKSGGIDHRLAGSVESFRVASKIAIKKVWTPVWTPFRTGSLELYVGE